MAATRVYLYQEPAAGLDYESLASYVRETLPWQEVALRPGFFQHCLPARGQAPSTGSGQALEEVALGFARAKVRNPVRQDLGFPPLPGEVEYERRRLAKRQDSTWGLLYDGLLAMEMCRELIPKGERGLEHIHIIFTNQLLGTWEEADRRYHARVAVFGFPSLLSATGLVEAPAKPREYYFLKQSYASLGMADAPALALEAEFRSRALAHGEGRLTEAMKGYVMQALFYHLTGDPFCPDPDCRLFNAHWQEEVLRAQLRGGQFCPRHQEEIRRLNRAALPIQAGGGRELS